MENETVFWRMMAVIIAVISVLWNAINTGLTFYIKRRINVRGIKLEEFRGQVRDTISIVLTKIYEHSKAAVALSRSESTADDIHKLNQNVVADLGYLRDALQDANNRNFADNSDWLDGFDQAEDGILGDFNKAANPITSTDDIKHSLVAVGEKMKTLRRSVRGRIEREIAKVK